MQPRLGVFPVAPSGCERHAKFGGRLLQCKLAVESQGDQACGVRIRLGQLLQCRMKIKDFDALCAPIQRYLDHRNLTGSAAAFLGEVCPGLLDQHIMHGTTQKVKKLPAIISRKPVACCEPFECGVDQSRSLQDTGPVSMKVMTGHLSEIVIDMSEETIQRAGLPLLHVAQKQGNCPQWDSSLPDSIYQF